MPNWAQTEIAAISTHHLASIALIASTAAASSTLATASSTQDVSDVTASLYCLSHSRFRFQDPKARQYRVRYIVDTRSFAGERHILLLVEAARGLTRWYDVEVFRMRPARGYRLTNNAELVGGRRALRIVSPPLGGIWAQDRFERVLAALRLQAAIMVKPSKKQAYREQCRSFDELFGG
ncbi:MAG: hypothetical protein U1E64_07610 [Sphingomonadaceae bacterium]